MSKTKNQVIDQINRDKQETDFRTAVSDLATVNGKALEQLHSAAHEVIRQLQGDLRLPEAAARHAILGPLLTVELTAFQALREQAIQQLSENPQRA